MKVIYPVQTGGQAEADRSVLYAYNAQGQQIWMKDAATNITEYDYDDSGRQTQKRLSTLDTGNFDGAVRRIATTYDSLGRTQLVTQYDNATVGSGSVTDEVKFTYEDWGMLSQRQQDNNSAIGSDDYDVKYTYAKSTGGRNTIQRSTLKYAYAGTDLATITYEYSSAGGLFDADASRVTDIKLSTTKIAEYNYNGVGSVVGTNLPEPDMYSYRYDPTTSGSYPDLDRFNRPTTDDWTKNLSTDRDTYSVALTYDRNSNITLLEDNIFTTGRDVQYTIDNINRLTKAEEGDWSGSAITSRSRQQIWTLDQLGNQTRVKLDLNGDNDFVDADESDDTRTHNNPNELKTQDTDSNSSTNYTLTYNKLGQMTDDGRYYKHVFDGFGRLIKITNRVNALVEQFWYDGLGERISWKYDSNSDHTVDGSDKKYHFAYDERWRLAMVFRESDTSPKEEHFFHAAGLDGQGGSSYIDTEVLRDKDSNSGWTSAADGTLEQRYYINQNWRADAVALVTSTGVQVEGDRHFSYGTPFGMCAGDVNGDGRVNSTDTTQIQTWVTGSAYDSRGDLDRDGDVDLTDKSTATTNAGINLGLGLLSSSTVFNRKGYAGYSFDPITSYAMFDVRHRELNADLGRWITRDPIGTGSGPNLYSYTNDNPLAFQDADGRDGVSFNPIRPISDPIQIGGCAKLTVARSDIQVVDPVLNLGASGPCSACGAAVAAITAFQSNPAAPLPTYSCPNGIGEQKPNPVTPCDIACTQVCNSQPGSRGVTICAGTDPTACICYENLKTLYPGIGPCFWNQMAACVLKHEKLHRCAINCSNNSPNTILDPTSPLLWKLKCDDSCTECEAWKVSDTCEQNINCNGCADSSLCNQYKAALHAERQQGIAQWCAACDQCKQQNGANCVSPPCP